MDAMSEAVEGADVMLYGVSLAYKESANCREYTSIQSNAMELVILRTRLTKPSLASLCVCAGLEANYVSHEHSQALDRTGTVPHVVCCSCLQGMQNECDMIPLMLQSNFKANGWLGLILGTRLWCKYSWRVDLRLTFF